MSVKAYLYLYQAVRFSWEEVTESRPFPPFPGVRGLKNGQ